jgi:4-diphosphocytidyl-2-C-methyl-D-erythritol kinase
MRRPTVTPLRLEAHAKVNLGLHVLGKRGDGYHDIDTIFSRLELHDTLWLEPQAQGITLDVTGATLPAGPENLAYRAAELYLEAASLRRGVNIVLEKRIPVAAGLGGGSSDAAAVLRGLARLYPAGLDLPALGRSLGADVPFFLQDWPAAQARGVGERLSRLELPRLHLVLANPDVPVSAKEAYANVRGFSPPLDGVVLLKSLAHGEEPQYHNDLQAGVLHLEPAICQVLAALCDAGLSGVLMSGSGATCFGLARDGAHAKRVAARLSASYPSWWVRASHTLGREC